MERDEVMLENYNDILEIEDLCEILNIGMNWGYRLLAEQKIQAFKIGRNWKIPKASLVNYILSEKKMPG